MTEPFRLLVTGSRSWSDAQRIYGALDAILAQMDGRPLTIVHGACPSGADAIAKRWARDRRRSSAQPDVATEAHYANWRKHGRRAGPLRNEAMVAAGADMCLAWISPCTRRDCPDPQPHGSHGASGCADLAEQAGIDTRRYYAAVRAGVLPLEKEGTTDG